MWNLEYALLFGVPGNKIELSEGRSRWAFPFLKRETAEAHFTEWLETLARWKGQDVPPKVLKKGSFWKAKVKGISMNLYPRPIEFKIPIVWEAFEAFEGNFWAPEMWPGEPPWRRRYLLANMDHQDVQMNLWKLFGGFCHRYGGLHSGRVDLVLNDNTVVAPDHYYFAKNPNECMIEKDYFFGIPDLIAEVLSPASWLIDPGPRQELYRRAKVPQLWLLDPERETVEVRVLEGKNYRHQATYGADDEFEISLFSGEMVKVNELFDTQCKRNDFDEREADPEPIPDWIISPDIELGLQYFFLLGHPERRWEIWGNKAPSVLAFGSPEEAKARLQHFLREASAWEGAALVTPTPMDDNVEQAEVGRFKFTRFGRHVHLDVAVDARKYRELLKVWTKREAWDWGEE